MFARWGKIGSMPLDRSRLLGPAWCKKIRDDQGYWNQVEECIRHHADLAFGHSKRSLRREAGESVNDALACTIVCTR